MIIRSGRSERARAAARREARDASEVLIYIYLGRRWARVEQDPDPIYPMHGKLEGLFGALRSRMRFGKGTDATCARNAMICGPTFLYAQGFTEEAIHEAVEEARPEIEAAEQRYRDWLASGKVLS